MPEATFTPAQVAQHVGQPADQPTDPYRDELHAIMEGALGILRHLVAVTPSAGNQADLVSSLWGRLAALRAGPPPAA